MIEQEQIVQEKKDVDVVSEEAKHEEKPSGIERISLALWGDPKNKKQMFYRAGCFFVIGALFAFAPTYIQTNIAWIVNASGMICIACWVICFFSISEYVHENKWNPDTALSYAIAFFFLVSIGLYIITEVPNQQMTAPDRVNARIYSFVLLFMVVLSLLDRLPTYLAFYRQKKDKIKAFFTAKHTAALILGILSVGTALFQFIQIVMQIFHL